MMKGGGEEGDEYDDHDDDNSENQNNDVSMSKGLRPVLLLH